MSDLENPPEIEPEAEPGSQPEAETPDDQKDMFWVLTKPISEMTLEEKQEAVGRLRELRKVRLTATKKKSQLDMAMAMLSPENAAKILKQLQGADFAKDKDTPNPKS